MWWMPTIFSRLVCLHSLILWHKAYRNGKSESIALNAFSFTSWYPYWVDSLDMDGFHRLHVNFQHPFLKMYGLLVRKVHSPTNEDSCSCSAKCSAEPKDGLWLRNMLSKSEWFLNLEKTELIGISETLSWWFYWSSVTTNKPACCWDDDCLSKRRNFLEYATTLALLNNSTSIWLLISSPGLCWKDGTPQIRDFQWFSSTSDTSLKHHLSWDMLGAWVGLAHKMSGWLGSNLNWSQPSVISNA